nr:MAG TPA: hypothetical protein [Crassvirales sp.]
MFLTIAKISIKSDITKFFKKNLTIHYGLG